MLSPVACLVAYDLAVASYLSVSFSWISSSAAVFCDCLTSFSSLRTYSSLSFRFSSLISSLIFSSWLDSYNLLAFSSLNWSCSYCLNGRNSSLLSSVNKNSGIFNCLRPSCRLFCKVVINSFSSFYVKIVDKGWLIKLSSLKWSIADTYLNRISYFAV